MKRGSSVRQLDQPKRITVTLIYLALLLILNSYLNEPGFPPFGLDGLWYYSAFAALLIGEYIIEPHFTTPAGALANGVALVLAVTAVDGASADVGSETFMLGRKALLGFGGLVLLLSLLAAYLNRRGERARAASRLASSLVGRIGRPKSVFGALLLASGYAAFADSPDKVALLYLSWFAIVAVDPVGNAIAWAPSAWRQSREALGVVEAIEDPGIAVVRFSDRDRIGLGSMLVFENDATGVIVDITRSLLTPIARVAFSPENPPALGSPLRLDPAARRPLVGHVGRETSLEELVIQAAPTVSETPIEESHLLATSIREKECLYQVTGVTITGETERHQTRDLLRISARKLGVWNQPATSFDAVPWVPDPGQEVELRVLPPVDPDPQFIGRIPGTPYGVRVDIHEAVTHNTAILGILGIGKTYLAWELVKRMLADGIKVVALDITGKYSRHFAALHPPDVESKLQREIGARIASNYDSYNLVDSHAGNVRDFERELHGVLTRFFNGDARLLILNPNGFAVSRIEGFPRQGAAERLFDLTMVEVTRMVAEKLLDLAQKADPGQEREEGKARLCLVLEEAHSLVPEWNSVAFEGEKTAVNGTARAILQGRKYGFGCMLITQRTANVTKSILNQCNTVFGLRNFDATGAGFLENYIGASYAALIATLKERHAIVFGRASSCNAPVVLRLNDAADFASAFWASQNIPPTVADALLSDDGKTDPAPTRSFD